jgi:aminoglycoside 3-N-acetyltransferase
MVTYRDLVTALRKLELDPARPVIVHASLSAFGQVQGGAQTVVGALLTCFPALMAPAFTYNTMITPEAGPPDNALAYGSRADRNRMADFFRPDLPVDPLIGLIPETLRRHPQAQRSSHPIQSFTGVRVEAALNAQNPSEPLAPLRILAEAGGYVLLLGVGHTANTSIHQGERLAGRKTFLRWALTPAGICECPGFPSCSDGFNSLNKHVERLTHRATAGQAQIQALPLPDLIDAVRRLVELEPLALLCSHPYCARCSAVRSAVERAGAPSGIPAR